MKWRSVFGVFRDHRIPIKLKRKFYKTAIRLAMPRSEERRVGKEC